MALPQIACNIWFRCIHETWANTSGWRTDIPKNVLMDEAVKKAAFVLDDERALFIDMDELRGALADCTLRPNGVVGPFNVDPHRSTVNGHTVNIEIRLPNPCRTAP
jgi:hypothetical protein